MLFLFVTFHNTPYLVEIDLIFLYMQHKRIMDQVNAWFYLLMIISSIFKNMFSEIVTKHPLPFKNW